MFALIVADFMSSQANELSARVSADVTRLIGKSLATACEGRVRELRAAHDLRLTQAERLETLAWKTATLFELPCQLGALLGGASATDAAALASYGRCLGLAFQLAEDAAGAAGQLTRFGTTLEADLRAGIYGIPVLHALRHGGDASARLRAALGRVPLPTTDARAAAQLVAECGGEAAARSLAKHHASRARAALARLPSSPSRHALERLAHYAANHPSSDAD
jgi:heptaprenyl diphosphate synthase